jgi:hypothetical protein
VAVCAVSSFGSAIRCAVNGSVPGSYPAACLVMSCAETSVS